jgi:hypothetical protein
MLARIDILESEELLGAVSRLWRQVELDYLAVVFNSSNDKTVRECNVLGLSPATLPGHRSPEPAHVPAELLPRFTKAIAEMASTIEKAMDGVSFSPATSQPSNTATMGFT